MTDTTAGAGVAPAIADVALAANETPVTEGQQAEGSEAAAPQMTAEERVKKLENALARKERRIGQVTAQRHQEARRAAEYEAELAKYRQGGQQQTSSQASGEPKEDDPKYAGSYVEYLKDLAKYHGKTVATEELAAGQRKADEARTTQEQQAWKSQRDSHLDSNAEAAEAAFTDFTNVINDATDIISSLSPHVHQAFLEAENGAFALYDLAQNPEALEKLNSMTPYAVAMAVARAEDRALAKSKQKPVTNAPAPLASAKGTSPGGKNLESMSADEILKAIRK